MANLKDDVIASTDSETIQITAEELLGRRDDLVKVLGSAFGQAFIEKDATKGLLRDNEVSSSQTLFGKQAAEVFQVVDTFVNQMAFGKKRSFKQIGQLLKEMQENWNLIE